MAKWEFAVQLRRESGLPLFQQIARAIGADIRSGRLRPGDPLPGTRTLARSLGVQRLTVAAAFDELLKEGWIVTERARGTFINRELPDPKPQPFARRTGASPVRNAKVPYTLRPGPTPELPYDVPAGALLLAPSRPDVRLSPGDLLGRTYRRALRKAGGALLNYGRPEGHARLREALARMLAATRGLPVSAENVCVTRGSQMAIWLVTQLLIRPGDVVLVEEWGYRPAWEVFRLAGARVIGIPVDVNGLRVDEMKPVLEREKVRAVYVTPHHQFPTTVMLSAARRLRLLELANTYGFAILEDDYDHEFHYAGRPILPLASADPHCSVIYFGTLSKVIGPALRIGYVVGPPPLINQLAAYRSIVDGHGDQAIEYAVSELMEEGEIQRHIRRVRREYAARRDTLADALRMELGDAITFEVPAGGTALWARVNPKIDVDAWAAAARARGVIVATGATFTLDGRSAPFLRLGFAPLDRAELVEAARRLAIALPRRRRPLHLKNLTAY